MKKAIVVSVRMSKDSKTSENTVWICAAVMPSKMNNGNLFYPKSSDILVTTCAGEIKSPDNFTKYKQLKIGDVVEINYSFNEYTQKPYISDIVLSKSTLYAESDLIV